MAAISTLTTSTPRAELAGVSRSTILPLYGKEQHHMLADTGSILTASVDERDLSAACGVLSGLAISMILYGAATVVWWVW